MGPRGATVSTGPVGPQGTATATGSTGHTGPTGASSGGSSYNPVVARYQFFSFTPLTNFSSDGSTSVFAGQTADTIYNLSARASYNSTTGRLGPAT